MILGIDQLLVYWLIATNNGRDSLLYILAKAPLYYFAGLFMPMILVVLAGLINKVCIRRLIVGAVLMIHTAITIADLFLWRNFGSLLDQMKIEILMGTDPYTVYEFLKLYVGVGGLLLMVVSIWLLYTIYRRVERRLLDCVLVSRLLTGTLAIATLAFSVWWGAAILLPGPNDKPGRLTARGGHAVSATALTRVGVDIRAALRSVGTTRDILDSIAAREESIIADDGTAPYVVFILGESNDRNRMSAYGYKNDTTPLMNKRLAAGEGVLFTDTIACANGTTAAMKLIFSFAEKSTESPWYENGCLIDVMNKAGYHTVWLSNQSGTDAYGNMDGVLAKLSGEQAFTTHDGSMSAPGRRTYDGELLPLLDASLAANTFDRSFYVIHLTGTHEEYNMRYPAEFAHFTDSDETGANANQRKVRAAYDNAMLYNDYIVDELISRFADKNAVVVFLSDHGSDVYDNDRDFAGHSVEELRNPHMIEVPLMVWGSDSFWASHGELRAALETAADRPYSTENVIHLILDIAGLRSTSYDSTKSVIDPNNIYQTKPRLYGGLPYVKK